MTKIVLTVIAALGVLWSADARAADSLLGTVGDTFTLFHMYSRADGKTVVDESIATVAKPNAVSRMLFSGPASNVRVMWLPGDFAMPKGASNSHEYASQFTLILQGDFIVEVSDGKEYRIKPGDILLAEDLNGPEHHRIRCEAENKAMGCVEIMVAPKDPATFFGNVRMGGPVAPRTAAPAGG